MAKGKLSGVIFAIYHWILSAACLQFLNIDLNDSVGDPKDVKSIIFDGS